MAKAKQLGTNVTLHKDGVAHTFSPGDELPDWAVEHLDGPDGNPAVWYSEDDEDGEEAESPAKAKAAKKAASAAAE